MTRQLNFCAAAVDTRWQLHDRLDFGLPISLLTWSHGAADMDGGPPLEVAQALAHSMVTSHRISFLVAADNVPTSAQVMGSTSEQTVASRGAASSLSARWHGEPTRWRWLSTRDAVVAETLFNQAGFDWTLQAQVVLLSAAEAPAPVLTLELTQALWRGGSPEAVDALVAAGVRVVIRPGVDGAALGAVGLRTGAVPAWVNVTQARCLEWGWLFLQVAESEL